MLKLKLEYRVGLHSYVRMYISMYTGGMMMMMTASSWLVHAVRVVTRLIYKSFYLSGFES